MPKFAKPLSSFAGAVRIRANRRSWNENRFFGLADGLKTKAARCNCTPNWKSVTLSLCTCPDRERDVPALIRRRITRRISRWTRSVPVPTASASRGTPLRGTPLAGRQAPASAPPATRRPTTRTIGGLEGRSRPFGSRRAGVSHRPVHWPTLSPVTREWRPHSAPTGSAAERNKRRVGDHVAGPSVGTAATRGVGTIRNEALRYDEVP